MKQSPRFPRDESTNAINCITEGGKVENRWTTYPAPMRLERLDSVTQPSIRNTGNTAYIATRCSPATKGSIEGLQGVQGEEGVPGVVTR